MRRSIRQAALALTLALASLVGTSAASADEVVTIGTVAPKQSLWGKVFGVWEQAVAKKTDGKLTLRVYYNGTQGDDGTMIGKLRAGQLDGAAVSSVGLAQIHKPILALQLPGLFRTWEGIDRARAAVAPELQAGAAAEGFVVNFGDLGRLRGMSKGFAARKPSDLRGKKVLAWRNDMIGPTVQQMIGQVTIVPLAAPEILPALRARSLDAMSAPSLAAEQLQWTPHLDHLGAETSVMAIGGLVWSKKRIDGLPGDLREVLVETGKRASAALKERVRAEDDAAYERLASKMTVVRLSDDERRAWRELFSKVIERLKQGTFDPKLVDKLIALADP